MVKTNAMRLLTTAKIPFDTVEYEVDEDDLSGVHTAEMLGTDPDCMFKTLVCRDDKGGYFVFCIPVAYELDLKKCAAAAGVKRVEMIHVKELLPLTGYIRGGCSPVGMKKKFPTLIDETATLYDRIYVSAGQRGVQLYLNPEQLAQYVDAKFADLLA
ncbi:MAG: Cys-tRNA(Pro) deacylase [Clostridia bacterium]|nr:Cys-tRNA(Pro) deacylase [Clostridia bacterium]MBQ8332169.1 Cys-tRNA(Pro) deacylase [Clostridia bacterium]MBQ8368373.1 Cys-tRNA(Pro) deacylase [Clostridia bacterium]MBQ8511684.1 Cys-tRNA(Pro) deacylase [Clostridia bacterium]